MTRCSTRRQCFHPTGEPFPSGAAWSILPGAHLLIPAGTAHRVPHTADPTIWPAARVDPQAAAS